MEGSHILQGLAPALDLGSSGPWGLGGQEQLRGTSVGLEWVVRQPCLAGLRVRGGQPPSGAG